MRTIYNFKHNRTVVILAIFILLYQPFIKAQKVENVTFEQTNKNIAISYDIEEEKNIDTYDIKIFYSIDDGLSWKGPLQYVSGDVGESQKAGKAKTIIWDVLKETTELTGNVKFQIKAKPHYIDKKSIEKSRKYMIGFKGGLNISKRLNYIEVYIKSKTGFNIGMFHKFQFNNVLGFQSELLFDRKGYTFDLSLYGEDELYPVNIDYFSVIPFLFNPSFGSRNTKFYFELGPFLEVLLTQKKLYPVLEQIEEEFNIPNMDTWYSAADCGLILGAGLAFYTNKSCVILNSRYSQAWVNGTSSCFSFNVGILF